MDGWRARHRTTLYSLTILLAGRTLGLECLPLVWWWMIKQYFLSGIRSRVYKDRIVVVFNYWSPTQKFMKGCIVRVHYDSAFNGNGLD